MITETFISGIDDSEYDHFSGDEKSVNCRSMGDSDSENTHTERIQATETNPDTPRDFAKPPKEPKTNNELKDEELSRNIFTTCFLVYLCGLFGCQVEFRKNRKRSNKVAKVVVEKVYKDNQIVLSMKEIEERLVKGSANDRGLIAMINGMVELLKGFGCEFVLGKVRRVFEARIDAKRHIFSVSFEGDVGKVTLSGQEIIKKGEYYYPQIRELTNGGLSYAR